MANPIYPVYIISKGRWESRMTSKALEEMKVPYRIVIEKQEYDNYAAVIDPKKILVLPFSNLGQGGIPARNWVWEHSISEGHKRHWILDDNICKFWRLNNNYRYPVKTGTTFRCCEDFVDRYKNVAMSGMQYFMFAPSREKHPPYLLNTRVYSCILLKNDIPFRWRGRYNEDTDLSIRILKAGWCTVLFVTFLAQKMPTLTMKGGNTDILYAGVNSGNKEEDGRYKMAKSLADQHPELARVSWKWNRYQHHVDYRRFKMNQLQYVDGFIKPKGINNYGMILRENKTPSLLSESIETDE